MPRLIALSLAAALLWVVSPVLAGEGAIRLNSGTSAPSAAARPEVVLSRDGFDYRAFESRLEALWLQRATYLRNGRDDDAARQADKILAFVQEQGIERMPSLSGALIAEGRRFLQQGELRRAEASLDFAYRLDAQRAPLRLARSHLYWKNGRGPVAAAGELFAAVRLGGANGLRDLSFLNRIALIAVLALAGTIGAFALFMLWRHGRLLRRELAAWFEHWVSAPVAQVLAWAVLLAPLLSWIAVGWAAFYWIALTFRHMERRERLVAVSLLGGAVLLIPGYSMAVALYSMTADPQVRTTLASADHHYDPNSILKLQRLVEASPEDPVYRFLLAGLYKDGRYYEEAFAEYRMALELDPSMHQAHVNIGNLFYSTSQFGQAVNEYNTALDLQARSLRAHYNLHLAHSEALRFKEAEGALSIARQIDGEQVAAWLGQTREGGRPQPQDATLQLASVWDAALSGRMPREGLIRRSEAATGGLASNPLFHPVPAVALCALIAALISAAVSSSEERAKQCIRCGDPYLPRQRRHPQESPEYCNQCYHLFVRGEGLAPGAKQRKMYDVQRFSRSQKRARTVASLLLPGAGHLLRGHVTVGCLLMAVWIAAWIAFRPELFSWVEQAIGLHLRLDLLTIPAVPAFYRVNVVAMLAAIAGLLTWVIANISAARSH